MNFVQLLLRFSIFMMVFGVFCEGIIRLFDLSCSHSRVHTLVSFMAVFSASVASPYITKWSSTDLFLTLCQQAVTGPRVSALSLILWHELRLNVDFKDSSLSYVERWDSTWQMMRNYSKNMRMFISDWWLWEQDGSGWEWKWKKTRKVVWSHLED